MIASFDEAARPLPGEKELLYRVARLHKRNDMPAITRIGVKNVAGEVRLTIHVHTQDELDGLNQLLMDRNFVDELFAEFEEELDSGGLESGFIQYDDPDFEFLYRPRNN